MRELIIKTQVWAEERGILANPGGAERQALKMVSEVGEFVDEILKGDAEKQKMEMGDIVVTLIVTGAKLGIDIEDALASAYNKIAARTGKLVDGVFVKD